VKQFELTETDAEAIFNYFNKEVSRLHLQKSLHLYSGSKVDRSLQYDEKIRKTEEIRDMIKFKE
jgi:hypothetical protein